MVESVGIRDTEAEPLCIDMATAVSILLSFCTIVFFGITVSLKKSCYRDIAISISIINVEDIDTILASYR